MRLRQSKGPQLRLLKAEAMPASSRAPLEKDIVEPIRNGIRRLGITHWSGRIFVHGHRPPYLPVFGAGTPDLILLFRNGRMGAIEVKRPGEKASNEQLFWHASFKASGGLLYLATDAEEAIQWAAATQRLCT